MWRKVVETRRCRLTKPLRPAPSARPPIRGGARLRMWRKVVEVVEAEASIFGSLRLIRFALPLAEACGGKVAARWRRACGGKVALKHVAARLIRFFDRSLRSLKHVAQGGGNAQVPINRKKRPAPSARPPAPNYVATPRPAAARQPDQIAPEATFPTQKKKTPPAHRAK